MEIISKSVDRLNMIMAFLPETLGLTRPIVNSYCVKDSQEAKIFRLSELLVLLEVFNHFAGIQSMKGNVLVFNMLAIGVAFFVIPLYSTVSSTNPPTG